MCGNCRAALQPWLQTSEPRQLQLLCLGSVWYCHITTNCWIQDTDYRGSHGRGLCTVFSTGTALKFLHLLMMKVKLHIFDTGSKFSLPGRETAFGQSQENSKFKETEFHPTGKDQEGTQHRRVQGTLNSVCFFLYACLCFFFFFF